MTLPQKLKAIRDRSPLSATEMAECMEDMLDGKASPAQIGAFLMGLSQRGETAEEISAAAKVLRHRAATIKAPASAIDCCGTGGDHSNSLNISTAVSFVVAACGVPVAKHGNRAASSQSGAADVLEALGVNLNLSHTSSERSLSDIGFCFLMAPLHHASLKPLSALRKELGFRTIFNLLGPLANPAGARRQLIGVFDKNFLLPMAKALKELGTENAWLVHGSDGMDEITLTGKTYVVKLEKDRIEETQLAPEDFGLPVIDAKDIAGYDARYNAKALKGLLDGHPSAYRNIVLANAAACLVISGVTNDLKQAVQIAASAIDNGKAKSVFETYRDFSIREGNAT